MALNPNFNMSSIPKGVKGVVSIDTRELNAFIQEFLGDLTASNGALALVKLGFDLTHLIILKTPVKSGRCRAAWYACQKQLGNLVGRGSGGYMPDSDMTRQGYGLGYVQASLSGLSKVITITNAVPYSILLEYGYSTQAPWGMVRVSIQEMMNQLPDYIMPHLQALWDKKKKNLGKKFTTWRATPSGPAPIGLRSRVSPTNRQRTKLRNRMKSVRAARGKGK